MINGKLSCMANILYAIKAWNRQYNIFTVIRNAIFLQKIKTSVLIKFKEWYVKSTMHKNISEMHWHFKSWTLS